MKYADMTPEQQAEHDAIVAVGMANVAAANAAAEVQQAERNARYAAMSDIPANIASVPALRDEVQRLADKMNLILEEMRK